MAETNVTTESSAEPAGTTAAAESGQTAGQSVTTDQTTSPGTGQGESFFDYESVKGTPNEPAYKLMQASFTKGKEEIKAGKEKIAMYDQIMRDPAGSITQWAGQNGYQLVKGELKADDGTPKSYNNWDEVKADFKESIRAEVMTELQPMLSEVQSMKKQGIEQMLDTAHPDWKTYEDDMMANLQAHPTLVNNPDLLYQMSVPKEVLEARATKAALAKIEGSTGNTIQSQSSTTQQATKKPVIKTVNDAANYARQELARRGIKKPTGE